MQGLYQYPLPAVIVVSFAFVLASSEIGWQLGARTKRAATSHVTVMEQSVLGLLALLIGFTFALALTRYEARRDAVLKEANAIGTTALRARMLPEPHRTETLKLLREYTQLRVDYIPSGKPLAALPNLISDSNRLQELLWQQAMAAAGKDANMVPTGFFIQTLNEMIDAQARRLAALRDSIPSLVLFALLGITAVACGLAGYAGGLESRGNRMPIYLTGALICAVIFVILDLDRPNGGFITISQQPMIDTLAGLQSMAK